MKNGITALIVGFLFAIGLGISGMTQTQKIIGFLDIFGKWDPTIVFVMSGAVIVHFITYKFIRKRKSPVLSPQWHVPNKRELTPSLIIGATVFGFGWGLGGFCPGPALTSVASFELKPILFVLSMIVGMILFRLLDTQLKLQK